MQYLNSIQGNRLSLISETPHKRVDNLQLNAKTGKSGQRALLVCRWNVMSESLYFLPKDARLPTL